MLDLENSILVSLEKTQVLKIKKHYKKENFKFIVNGRSIQIYNLQGLRVVSMLKYSCGYSVIISKQYVENIKQLLK